jgi:hypothetical protein
MEANVKTTVLARVRSLSRALDDSTDATLYRPSLSRTEVDESSSELLDQRSAR